MYAVIETGGKQYRVEKGDVIDVERTSALEAKKIRFDRVLLVAGKGSVKVGHPVVEGAVVSAELLGPVRGPKIRVFKMKRRKGYRRARGHRQELVRVRIGTIKG